MNDKELVQAALAHLRSAWDWEAGKGPAFEVKRHEGLGQDEIHYTQAEAVDANKRAAIYLVAHAFAEGWRRGKEAKR